mgnify:CR=1 FL=1
MFVYVVIHTGAMIMNKRFLTTLGLTATLSVVIAIGLLTREKTLLTPALATSKAPDLIQLF